MRYYVPTDVSGTADGSRIGLAWLRSHAEEYAGEPLVVVPAATSRRNRYIEAAMAGRRWVASSGYRGASLRGWQHGPVLLFFPTSGVLDWFDASSKVEALCVVQGVRFDTTAWAIARRAEDLTRGRVFGDGQDLDPAVASTLAEMQHRQDWSGMGTSEGIDVAVETLRRLRSGGHSFVPTTLEAWALTQDWRPTDARRLRSHATRVLDGPAPPGG